jgi:hypothetical protein
MHITFGRKSRLTALGASLITAAAVAVLASGPALADTADTGGTGALSVPTAVVVGLANANIVMLPGNPTSSSFDPVAGADTVTMPVTGGNGEVGNFTGNVAYGGSLVFINAKAGKTVIITSLRLNFFTGAITGVFQGGTTHTALGYINGNMSTSSNPGPPATETFSTDEVDLSGKAAKALNTGLATTVFERGINIGAFTTTFDVTIT